MGRVVAEAAGVDAEELIFAGQRVLLPVFAEADVEVSYLPLTLPGRRVVEFEPLRLPTDTPGRVDIPLLVELPAVGRAPLPPPVEAQL